MNQLEIIPKVSSLCTQGKRDEATKLAEKIERPKIREKALSLIEQSRKINNPDLELIPAIALKLID